MNKREQEENIIHKSTNPYKPPIPFSNRLRSEKQDKKFLKFYNVMSKLNVNLSLIDVIENVPVYYKFLKELTSKKCQFIDDEEVIISNAASTILLPNNENDPGSFTINIVMENGN